MPSSASRANEVWPRARSIENSNANAAASRAAETVSLRSLGASGARNPLQIVDEAYFVPTCEQLRKRIPLTVADFKQQPAVGFEHCPRLRYQTPIYVEALRSSEERDSRFVVAHLRLEHFTLGNIRRIRDDHVEALAGNGFEQVGLDKANAIANVMAHGVAPRDSECRSRDIKCSDLGPWQRMGERRSNYP